VTAALLATAGMLCVLLAVWAGLAVLARRLPEGLARDVVGFLPACVTLARRLRGDERVPMRAKVAVALAAVYLLSPLDIVPDFVPVLGALDDAVVLAIALRYAGRRIPRQVLADAWPGDPRLLDRLLGRR